MYANIVDLYWHISMFESIICVNHHPRERIGGRNYETQRQKKEKCRAETAARLL